MTVTRWKSGALRRTNSQFSIKFSIFLVHTINESEM